jgi:hypothetical protein
LRESLVFGEGEAALELTIANAAKDDGVRARIEGDRLSAELLPRPAVDADTDAIELFASARQNAKHARGDSGLDLVEPAPAVLVQPGGAGVARAVGKCRFRIT